MSQLHQYQRRRLLGVAALLPLTGLAGCAPAEAVRDFPTLASAQAAIERASAGGLKSSGAWTLAQVLTHAAQSIEFSMSGFPELKPELFRATLGRAAFAFFDARGAMRHALDEPIPGAPELNPQTALPAAAARCLDSLRRFEAHTGALAPHFAYGALDKAQYTRAHLMHLANHWTEIGPA
ncbi:DUF1569 domain-containing protein [Rivibacter subsaxonicus]|uniref:Uncharacterized protein DUF1569 n=1 Tax=Rivibacter subsaxonicus TaxID=457575 RepID=A0A4Q7VV45_9BURK|nr:DUF1569 domain-containing protein [Rivibacter subsaxonicus]RZU00511.1 uncharacterized protein DUF1569 [Rivibacter subsaxonicus]